VARTLSVDIDRPVAGALVGPVAHVSGPLFAHQVDRDIVPVGTGSPVTARVAGPDLLTAADLCGTTSADTAFGRPRAVARGSVRLGRLATCFGRAVRQAEARAEETCAASRHVHLTDVRTDRAGNGLECRPVQVPLPPVTTGETAWFAARRLVRTPWALTAARPD
jgi:hypothetical protein